MLLGVDLRPLGTNFGPIGVNFRPLGVVLRSEVRFFATGSPFSFLEVALWSLGVDFSY